MQYKQSKVDLEMMLLSALKLGKRYRDEDDDEDKR